MTGSEVTALVVAVTAGIALTVLAFVIVAPAAHRAPPPGDRRVPAGRERGRRRRAAGGRGQHQPRAERVDNLLRSAESVSGTVDSATRLAYLTVGSPVVKGLAVATGANQAYRRFRGVRRH